MKERGQQPVSSNLLHIDTDQVQSISNQMIQAQDEIEQNTQRVLAEVNSLDWMSPGRDSLIAEMESLAQQVRQLTEQGHQLAQRLNQEISEWETAAQSFTGVSAANGVGTNVVDSGGGSILPFTLLPIIIPVISSPFFIRPRLIPGLPEWVQDIFRKLFPTPPTPIDEKKTVPDVPAEEPEPVNNTEPEQKTGFGKLIEEKKPAETVTTSASDSSQESQVKVETPDQYWNVPIQSQQGLDYNGKDTQYGCAPTSASMITEYWHQRDDRNGTISAQDLIDKNVEQKEFGYRGMSTSNLENDLEPLGYDVETYAGPVEGPDNETSAFKDALAKGPVVAIVRLNMDEHSKDVHAVVVTGISPEGVVRINDPWDGKVKDYSWDDFYKVWGSDFGNNKDGNPYPTRGFTTIIPKGG